MLSRRQLDGQQHQATMSIRIAITPRSFRHSRLHLESVHSRIFMRERERTGLFRVGIDEGELLTEQTI